MGSESEAEVDILKYQLCIPTLNAGNHLKALLSAIRQQTLPPDNSLIIDSGSTDETVSIASEAGAAVHAIPRTEFNHGGTRQLGVTMMADADIIVFLTQDAIPAHPEALENLLACFADERVGAAYGRQLPRRGAGSIEAHARLFNYPQQSRVKSMADAAGLGIKTAFISNSFAAYRRSALAAVGGFPLNAICTEDTHVAARMLIAGWKVAYCAEAKVYHSHGYGYWQEFRRYFDIGFFYGRETWLRQAFGNAEGEGARFLRSEFTYLLRNKPVLIPSALLRTLLKLLGYRLGFMEEILPERLKAFFSMNKGYWQNQ